MNFSKKNYSLSRYFGKLKKNNRNAVSKTTLTLIAILFVAMTSIAQNGINYKAVIKDNIGNVIANQSITLQFSILKGDVAQTNVYSESHPTTTDDNGIAIANIGEGTLVGSSPAFNTIDWGSDEHYLNVQINTGGGLTDMGTTQFMAVPYALNVANMNINALTDGKSDVNFSSLFLGQGSGTNLTNLNGGNVGVGFNSLNANTIGFFNNAFGSLAMEENISGAGNVAFGHEALKNNLVGNDNVALGGGAGGFVNGSNNVVIGQNAGNAGILSTNTGNVLLGYRAGLNGVFNNRLYIENSGSTSPLIYGEFDNDLLRVNGTLNINGEYSFPILDGADGQYLKTDGTGNVTWEDSSTSDIHSINDLLDGISDGYSLFLGSGAGINDDSTFNDNIGLGINSLFTNITGQNNVAVGYTSLYQNVDGEENIAIGSQSLYENTSGAHNVAIGHTAMFKNLTGIFNTAIGKNSLYSNITGYNNTALGYNTLSSNNSGNRNTAVGNSALSGNIDGIKNVATGAFALSALTSGSENTIIGYSAFSQNQTGNNNVSIGNLSGFGNISGSGNVFIGYKAGYNESGSNKLYVETTSSGLPLIYGEFDNDFLKFNADTEINGTAQINGRTEISVNIPANGNPGTGSLEIANSLRLDATQIFTNTNTTLRLQNGNNGDLEVDSNTFRVDASENRVGINTGSPDYTLSVQGQLNINENISTGAAALRVNGAEALWFNGTYFSWGLGGTANHFADRIGIGTTTPDHLLSVKGPANLNEDIATGAAALRVNGDEALWYDGNYFSWGFGGNANYFGDPVGIGTSTPNAGLHVIYNVDASPVGGGSIIIGSTSSHNLVLDRDEIMARNNGVVSDLHLQNDGGNVRVGGALVHSSDRRLKEDIGDLSYGLNTILKLQPQSYYWKNRPQNIKSFGLIAQDVKAIVPELVNEDDSEEKLLSINYTELIPILINALKEQQTIIESQKGKIENLEKRQERVEAMLGSLVKTSN